MNYLLRGILNFGIFSLFQRYQHLKAFKVHIKGAKMATKRVLELDNRRWALWIVCATTNHGNISIMSYYIICQCLYYIICFNRKKPCQAFDLVPGRTFQGSNSDGLIPAPPGQGTQPGFSSNVLELWGSDGIKFKA